MSYALSGALQAAVFQYLSTDARLAGVAIHHALPVGVVPAQYVLLGGEEVRDRSDVTGAAAIHRFTVLVQGDSAGFSGIKQIASAVCDALIDAPLVLARGQLIGLWFDRARRMRDGSRQIELRFRARVEDG